MAPFIWTLMLLAALLAQPSKISRTVAHDGDGGTQCKVQQDMADDTCN